MKQKILFVLLMIFSLNLLIGCGTSYTLKVDSMKSFRNDITTQHDEVRNITAKYQPALLEITISLRADTDKSVKMGILYEVQAFVESPEFQEEFFDVFFERWPPEIPSVKYYPDVTIVIDEEGKEEVAAFTAHYYSNAEPVDVDIDEETDEFIVETPEVDGYTTWNEGR